MTARTCPVHGEYAPTGICRWCEPAPANTWEADHPGSTRCRCGKYAWAPGAAELNYVDPDRVAHSPDQCFKLDAKPPTYMGVPVVVDPHMSADAPPVLVSWTLIEKTDEAYGWRLEWTAPVPPGPELNADKERRLAEEHAALRWERVARRWDCKHGPWNMRDVAQHWQFFLNKLIALQLKRINEMLKEPKS